jgi:hypothetical protein
MSVWNRWQATGLVIASVVTFAGVLMFAGHDPQSLASTTPATTVPGAANTVANLPQLSAEKSRQPSHAAEASNPVPKVKPQISRESPAQVAELTRQVAPFDETTAEENEQRGDAIRRLGASDNGEAVPGLVYALRNDVDVRNRILAIDGLRRAALAGNTDSRITDALGDVARADDELLAAQARAALGEISRGY